MGGVGGVHITIILICSRPVVLNSQEERVNNDLEFFYQKWKLVEDGGLDI